MPDFSEQLLQTLPKGSNPDKLTIDQVNIAMRNSPVWNQWLQAHGKNPASVKLSDSDKNGLAKTLENNGFPLPEGWEIDDSGNIREETHVGRNLLIAAGVAAAAFGGYAVLAAMGPEAGAGAAAAEAGGEAAGLGGVEAGAVAGIDASVASGSLGMAALPALEVESAVAAGGAVAADGSVWDAAGNFIGNSTVTDSTVGGIATDASTLSKIGGLVKGGMKVADALKAAGIGVSNATQAAGQNRLNQEQLGLTANQQNIQGQSSFESELMNRAKLEDTQRSEAQKNIYKASVANNPVKSPFDPTGGPKYSSSYLEAIGNLDKQGGAMLAKPAATQASSLPPLAPYVPVNPSNVQGATGQNPSTLENIGRFAGPALSTYGSFMDYWNSR